MTLGERLKEYRVKEGLSQEQLAERLNVSRQAITKWENDKGIPDIDNLITISRMMGVTLDELVMGEARIKEEAADQRKNSMKGHLIAAIILFFAAVCWIISGCLNLDFNTLIVPVLNFVSAIFCMVAAGFQVRKYLERSEQG